MVIMTNKNMKTSSSPAEIVGSLDDLLTEFFQRIPLKPLFRLKLVSKHWNSLISDRKLHSSRYKKPVGYLFHNQNPYFQKGKQHTLLLSLDHRPSTVGPPSISELQISKKKRKDLGSKVFHSCNGLLVGYYNACTRKTKINYHDYFVYNPTTGEYKSIPSPVVSSKSLWMYLAFDPSDSPHYKIVCVSWPWSQEYITIRLQRYEFAVYSSATCSWKNYDNEFSSTFIDFEKGVYWNGSIHWISFSETFSFSETEEESIYITPRHPRRDQSLPVLEMPTPPMFDGFRSKNYFGESCDHLNLISYYGSINEDNKLKVYEMRRDYSEWFVKYNVNVSNVWSRVWNKGLGNFGRRKSFVVCGLVRGFDEEDSSFLVLLIKRRMMVFNLATETFEITGAFDEKEYYEVYDKVNAFPSGRNPLYCPLQYVESLCSL